MVDILCVVSKSSDNRLKTYRLKDKETNTYPGDFGNVMRVIRVLKVIGNKFHSMLL